MVDDTSESEKNVSIPSPKGLTERAFQPSDFERRLFIDGVLTFDFNEYVKEKSEELGELSDWQKEVGWDEIWSATIMAEEV